MRLKLDGIRDGRLWSDAGIVEKTEGMFREMVSDCGAALKTVEKHIGI